MEDVLHQLICSLPHYLQGFTHFSHQQYVRYFHHVEECSKVPLPKKTLETKCGWSTSCWDCVGNSFMVQKRRDVVKQTLIKIIFKRLLHFVWITAVLHFLLLDISYWNGRLSRKLLAGLSSHLYHWLYLLYGLYRAYLGKHWGTNC